MDHTVRVQVSGIAGHLCTVAMGIEESVAVLKRAVAAETNIPAIEQRLILGEQELAEARRMTDLAVAQQVKGDDHVEVQLVRRTAEQARWLQQLHDCQEVRVCFSALPAEARADREVALAAIAGDGRALAWAAEELRADRDVVLAAVAEDGRALVFAVAELKADRDVVLAAILQTGTALHFAAAELCSDHDVVLTAVAQNGYSLKYAAAELRGDRDVVLAAVAQDGWSLAFAAAELRADRSVVLAAVAQSGEALQFAATELHADRGVVLTAVTQDSAALRFAAEELRHELRSELQDAAPAVVVASSPKRGP